MVATASTSLGTVLVDGKGMTLYMFDPDNKAASTCYGDCAVAWPPLVVDGAPSAGAGADGSMLGTTTRDDGSTQVTYAGWPLYTFVKDTAPGDVTGQGVGGTWWVMTADGAPVKG
jgi:predicted lipoprotein with Yx(FWY)xxD motif